jgi:hypothetical protein
MLPAIASGADVAAGRNPFEAVAYWVNSQYQLRVQQSMAARWSEDKHTSSQMTGMLRVPSAFWVDRISKIRRSTAGAEASLQSILEDAGSSPVPPLVVIILCTQAVAQTSIVQPRHPTHNLDGVAHQRILDESLIGPWFKPCVWRRRPAKPRLPRVRF